MATAITVKGDLLMLSISQLKSSRVDGPVFAAKFHAALENRDANQISEVARFTPVDRSNSAVFLFGLLFGFEAFLFCFSSAALRLHKAALFI
uniref:Uncharacterized protein n=1 Tax=Magnetococcus massalia (strain MO-1) TaxID=451514 RepID=A0A1S7LE91_MAGMO|nr:protein of unknown function [Candidatus Magnetococcus massalia]